MATNIMVRMFYLKQLQRHLILFVAFSHIHHNALLIAFKTLKQFKKMQMKSIWGKK